jgi:hypothetical protein
MFGAPKPTASLSSGLLARKGQARPAMRSQGYVGLTPGSAQDDLGWNDMGDDAGHSAPQPQPEAKPPVLRQIEALDERLSQPEPKPAAAPASPAPERKSVSLARVAREVQKKSKAAFTLRLDQDRHLRLRLAAAVTHRSAQQIVTEALDAFLESLDQVEALARQLDSARK